MKIIHIETVLSKPHLETSGEIALRLKENKKNVVKFVYLGNNLLWNDWELPYFLNYFKFFDNKKRIQAFYNILKEKKIEILNQNKFDSFEKNKILKWSKKFQGNLAELNNLEYRNYKIGKSIASSLISYFRNLNPDMNRHKIKIQQMIYSSVTVLKRTEILINLEKPNQIVTFNGRFSITNPIILVAKKFGIPVWQHDRGSNYNKFETFEKNIHDYRYRYSMVRRYWLLAKDNKKRIGHSYFIERKKKKSLGTDYGFHFTKKQKNNYLSFKKTNKKIIVFYTSTDYEMAAIFNNYNQENKFKLLYSVVSQLSHVHLIIRVHPDVKKKNFIEDLKWKKYNSSFCTVLESDNITDSYKLLKIADIIIGYSSSIMLEALYWKKNAYTLDTNNLYYYSEVVKLISNKFEIINILKKKYEFKKSDLEKCLSIGYYFKTYGSKFKYYTPHDFSKGKFMGQNLEWKSQIILFLEKIRLKFIYYYIKEKKYK